MKESDFKHAVNQEKNGLPTETMIIVMVLILISMSISLYTVRKQEQTAQALQSLTEDFQKAVNTSSLSVESVCLRAQAGINELDRSSKIIKEGIDLLNLSIKELTESRTQIDHRLKTHGQ